MWVTLDFARKLWKDAPADDDILTTYLTAAQVACAAYAPPLLVGSPVPSNYALAVVMQARNIWNSSKAAPASGDFDNGGYGLSSFPLDWQVQQLLRPLLAFGGVA